MNFLARYSLQSTENAFLCMSKYRAFFAGVAAGFLHLCPMTSSPMLLEYLDLVKEVFGSMATYHTLKLSFIELVSDLPSKLY